MSFSPLWSHQLAAPLLGLALAREPLHLLAWDEGRRLTLWDREGRVLATQSLLHAPTAVAISDDGQRVLAACQDGSLWWFDGALQLQFDQRWDAEPCAVALEPQGEMAIVSDVRGRNTFVAPGGDRHASWDTPRPLAHVCFVPMRAGIVSAASYGYVAAFDRDGHALWRDGPLSHVNGLHVDGDGAHVVLACYSAGVQAYRWRDGRRSALATPHLCRLVAIDFAAENLLVAHETPSLALLGNDGQVRTEYELPQPAIAMVLGALGNVGAYGLATGDVTFFTIAASGAA